MGNAETNNSYISKQQWPNFEVASKKANALIKQPDYQFSQEESLRIIELTPMEPTLRALFLRLIRHDYSYSSQ